MIKYNTWTITVLLIVSYIASYYYGLVSYLLEIDATRITMIVPVLVLFVALAANWMTFTGRFPRMLRRQMEYVSTNMTALGLLGTMLGMWMALRHGIPEPHQLLVGLSIALTTTIAGITGAFVTEQVMLQMEEARRNVSTPF